MGSFSTPTEQLAATSAAEKGPAISDSGSPALAADRRGSDGGQTSTDASTTSSRKRGA